jgi:nicotinamidase/pyrazinamidase
MAYSKRRQHRNKKGGKRGSRGIRGGGDVGNLTNIKIKSDDKLILLIIDPQNDFHKENKAMGRPVDGPLKVAGSNEDSARIASLIKGGVGGRQFDQIIVTLDTHNVNHIAHSTFWKKMSSDESPPHFTVIKSEDVGKLWVPRDASLIKYCEKYCSDLQKKGNYDLCIWPHHCIQGTPGHAVVKEISDQLFQWSKKTGKTVDYRQKGQNNLTEMYSAIKAEVPINSDPKTDENTDLLNALLDPTYDYRNPTGKEIFHSDSIRKGLEMDVAGSQFSYSPEQTFSNTKVFICGEALDYCVYSTTKDIIEYVTRNNMEGKLPNLILLTNCTSEIASRPKIDEFKDKITFATVGENSSIVQPAQPKQVQSKPAWDSSQTAVIKLN